MRIEGGLTYTQRRERKERKKESTTFFPFGCNFRSLWYRLFGELGGVCGAWGGWMMCKSSVSRAGDE